jgi:hypothetical protein
LSWFGPRTIVRFLIPAGTPPILALWYMPCILLASTGCLIPLPLHPQELRVPKILNPTPDDGTIEISPYVDKTISAVISDPDTLIADLIVVWTVGDEDITYLGTQTPDAEGEDLYVKLDLFAEDFDELSGHDQETIELYVSDHDNEATETWLLTVLGEKP